MTSNGSLVHFLSDDNNGRVLCGLQRSTRKHITTKRKDVTCPHCLQRLHHKSTIADRVRQEIYLARQALAENIQEYCQSRNIRPSDLNVRQLIHKLQDDDKI